MHRLTLAAAIVLAGCGAPRTAPQPLAAEIGSGAFGNCPGLTWRIVPQAPNLLRRVVEEGLALLAADSLLAPNVLIEVTDAAGRTTAFASPPPPPTPRG